MVGKRRCNRTNHIQLGVSENGAYPPRQPKNCFNEESGDKPWDLVIWGTPMFRQQQKNGHSMNSAKHETGRMEKYHFNGITTSPQGGAL